jgi:hypothetical protein
LHSLRDHGQEDELAGRSVSRETKSSRSDDAGLSKKAGGINYRRQFNRDPRSAEAIRDLLRQGVTKAQIHDLRFELEAIPFIWRYAQKEARPIVHARRARLAKVLRRTVEVLRKDLDAYELTLRQLDCDLRGLRFARKKSDRILADGLQRAAEILEDSTGAGVLRTPGMDRRVTLQTYAFRTVFSFLIHLLPRGKRLKKLTAQLVGALLGVNIKANSFAHDPEVRAIRAPKKYHRE